jgi:hypothetical protein
MGALDVLSVWKPDSVKWFISGRVHMNAYSANPPSKKRSGYALKVSLKISETSLWQKCGNSTDLQEDVG